MTKKDHIKNILRGVMKGQPNSTEGVDGYLDRNARAILKLVEDKAPVAIRSEAIVEEPRHKVKKSKKEESEKE